MAGDNAGRGFFEGVRKETLLMNLEMEKKAIEVLSQLKIIFGDWSDWKHYKMDRLEERINAINGTKENDC